MCELAIFSYAKAAMKVIQESTGKHILHPDLIALIYINHKKIARYAEIASHLAGTQSATMGWGRLQAGLKRLAERGLITHIKDGRAFLYIITMAGTELVNRYQSRLKELAERSELST